MDDFQEYFEMLMVLGECRKHYRNPQDLYAARYLDRLQKSHMTFKRIVNGNNAASILAFAALNPHASSKRMETRVELVSDLY